MGVSSFSKCKMYSNINWTSVHPPKDYHPPNSTANQHSSIIDCEVHEFDKRWYESTIVSQEDWVCSKDLYQTNTFVFQRIGEMFGTFFFGQLGDTLGRKMIYYISILFMVGGRLFALLTPGHYILFASAAIIGSLAAMSIFQSPFIIAMEIAKPDNRADVAMIQSLAWTGGQCLLPMIFWWLREWQYFFLMSTLPLALFLFVPKYMIESPRWLANRGRLDKAAEVLNLIGQVNGKSINITEKLLRSTLPTEEPEKVYGMLSLFSGWRLSKNSFILIVCWSICTLAYFTLVLYIAQMAGNPFLNFLIQSASEAPAYLLGGYMANRIGRRLTNSISFFMAALFCIPTVFLVTHSEWQFAATCLTIIIKFWGAITFFAVNLQSMETYPTCLRQTGISCGAIFSNGVGVLGPYIAYLGTRYDMRYPILILLALLVSGGLCGLFLPETLHQKLPDSMEEARLFGAEQRFWSLPKKPKVADPKPNDSENKTDVLRF